MVWTTNHRKKSKDGRSFAGTIMVTLLPNDIYGKTATLIIFFYIMESVYKKLNKKCVCVCVQRDDQFGGAGPKLQSTAVYTSPGTTPDQKSLT